MPDSDLPELDAFAMDLTHTMLPASEIRRRGDRHRRRRTALVVGGGALAVALAVGAPVIALSGGGNNRGVGPVDTPSPSVTQDTEDTEDAGGAWVTAVPDDFPLTAGFPTPAREADHGELPTCGGLSLAQFADNRIVTYTGESEDTAQRMLVLFPDDDGAREMLAGLKQATSECAAVPVPGGGAETLVAPIPFDQVAGSAEETYAFAEQVHHDDGLVSDLTLVEVARTGNALYVDSSYGAAGGDEVVAEQAARLLQRSTAPLQSLCLFAANPCVIGSAAPAPDGGTDTGDIPDGFALETGLATDADTEVTGPDPDIDGVSFADLCQTQAWPGAGTTDRLAVRLTGIEYAVTRELVTYEDADAAASVVAALSDSFAACPESPSADGETANDRLFQSLEADTGYESSLTFGFAYRQGVGGTLFQVVRVGRAVLATSASGDFFLSSLDSGVAGLTDDNRQVADLMCEFSAAGC